MSNAIETQSPDLGWAIARFLGSHWGATADTYRKALELVPLAVRGDREVASFPWQRIGHEELAAVRERLSERGYAPATVNRTLRATRSLIRSLARSGVVTRERAAEMGDVRDLPLPYGMGPGRALEGDEQARLFAAARADRVAPRFMAALVALLLAGGLRRGEAGGFLMSDLSDYDPETGRLLVRFGKGRKQRVVFMAGAAKDALDAFVAADDRGCTYRALATSQVGHLFQKLCKRAGVADASPHDCRRTVASTLLERTDVATAQAILGHASPAQTVRYDRRSEERLAKAAYDPFGGEA